MFATSLCLGPRTRRAPRRYAGQGVVVPQRSRKLLTLPSVAQSQRMQSNAAADVTADDARVHVVLHCNCRPNLTQVKTSTRQHQQ